MFLLLPLESLVSKQRMLRGEEEAVKIVELVLLFETSGGHFCTTTGDAGASRSFSSSFIHALGLSFPDTFVPLNLVHCFLLPLLLIFSPYVWRSIGSSFTVFIVLLYVVCIHSFFIDKEMNEKKSEWVNSSFRTSFGCIANKSLFL